MTNSLQSVSQFMNKFHNPRGAALGFYGACSSVGGIVATIVAGPITDRLGRRALCFIGSGIVISMAIMETFSTSFHMFTAGKLLLGFGANLQQIGGPMLVVELAHPKSREAISSVYNTSIFLGEIIGAWITFGTFSIPSNWSWGIPCIIQILLPAYQFLTIWLCPESPRWLVSKGRVEKARDILVKYHGDGEETELVKMELQEIIAGVEVDRTQLRFNSAGLKSIFGSKGNLRRLWIVTITAIGSQCSGSVLISAYLPQILDEVGFSTSRDKTLINGLVDIASWVTGVIAAFTIPHMRRRTVFLVATGGMIAIFAVWTALSAEYLQTGRAKLGIGVVVMVFLFNMVYCTCWLPLIITYPSEIITTKQRGIFFSWTFFVINSSSFVVSFARHLVINRSYTDQTFLSTHILLLLDLTAYHGNTTSFKLFLMLPLYSLSSLHLSKLKE